MSFHSPLCLSDIPGSHIPPVELLVLSAEYVFSRTYLKYRDAIISAEQDHKIYLNCWLYQQNIFLSSGEIARNLNNIMT
jgi:hypothetical protein